MSKKKSGKVGRIILIIIIAIIIGLMIAWLRLPSILSNKLSDRMGTEVSIESIGTTFFSVSVNDISIANPEGSVLPTAFMTEKIKVSAPLTNYLSKDIVIDEISLDKIYLSLEFNSARSANGNWTDLMGNMKQTAEPAAPTPPGEEHSVLIKKLVLTNLLADVVYRDNPKNVRELPLIDRMELTDISTSGGLPLDQILDSVLGKMLTSIFIKENLQNMVEGLLRDELLRPDRLLPIPDQINPLPKLFGVTEPLENPDAA